MKKIKWLIGLIVGGMFCSIVPLFLYFFIPISTNVLILGIDGGLGRGDLGRTDTIILTTINPLEAYVGMLSIPRDLWVPIDNVGENRINTAYFFAEAEEVGTGAKATIKTVEDNFQVPVDYYIVFRMDGMLQFIDALGGIDITLSKETAGFSEGIHHFSGEEALKFVRSRAGSDDFSRMGQAQLLIKSVVKRMLVPYVWKKLPEILTATQTIVKMNIPVLLWPRLFFALIRSGDNIDARVINRDMVQPFTTDQGAQVLLPNWDVIRKTTSEMFKK